MVLGDIPQLKNDALNGSCRSVLHGLGAQVVEADHRRDELEFMEAREVASITHVDP